MPLIPTVMAIAGGMILAAWYFYALRVYRNRTIRLQTRPIRSIDAWMTSYAGSSPDIDRAVVTDVLDYIAAEYGVAPTQLLPTDSFYNELSCKDSWRWLPNGDEQWENVTEGFEVRFGQPWDPTWKTVADVVEAVSQTKVKNT